jgi:hypothetical protein
MSLSPFLERLLSQQMKFKKTRETFPQEESQVMLSANIQPALHSLDSQASQRPGPHRLQPSPQASISAEDDGIRETALEDFLGEKMPSPDLPPLAHPGLHIAPTVLAVLVLHQTTI